MKRDKRRREKGRCVWKKKERRTETEGRNEEQCPDVHTGTSVIHEVGVCVNKESQSPTFQSHRWAKETLERLG